jgi:hypothetical protein
VKWAVITKPKKKGGLGVKDLRKMNISLLCKWWWKFENEEGLWQEIVRKKYRVKGGIASLREKPTNSPVWNDLIKVKNMYLAGRIMKVGNGADTDFWEDPWCGNIALKSRFRSLYEINNEQHTSVAERAQRGWRLTFRRWLDEYDQNQLRQLRDMLLACPLGQQKDKPSWAWGKHKIFSVKSMYTHLCVGEVGGSNKKIWKAQIPLKIKVFMWLITQNAILTKDNMIKRNWQGDRHCRFCDKEENLVHLFFDCPLAKYV